MTNVRIWFKKTGVVRFISHLDLNRCISKAARRSRIPFWYTEGFNPHLYITFNTPLSLGYESICESFDCRLTEDIPFAEVIQRLNACLPQGIQVYQVAYPTYKPIDIIASDYEIVLSKVLWKESLMAFLAQEEILTEKKTKKGRKEINLKEFIFHYTIEETEKDTLLHIALATGGNGNINPALLLDLFLSEQNGDAILIRCCRTKIYVSEFCEFS